MTVRTYGAIETAPAYALTGLLGASAPSRIVGATTSGAPTSGQFNKGDFVIDQSGGAWICTASGTPGTWKSISTSVQVIGDVLLNSNQATVTFSNIPQTFKHLQLFISARSTNTAADTLTMSMNGQTTNHYYEEVYGSSTANGPGSGIATIGSLPYSSSPSGQFSQGVLNFSDYANASKFPSYQGIHNLTYNTPYFVNGYLNTLGALTSIQLAVTTTSQNLASGSRFTLYGIN